MLTLPPTENSTKLFHLSLKEFNFLDPNHVSSDFGHDFLERKLWAVFPKSSTNLCVNSSTGFSVPALVLNRAKLTTKLTKEEAEDPEGCGISRPVQQADNAGPAGQVPTFKAQEAPGPAGGSLGPLLLSGHLLEGRSRRPLCFWSTKRRRQRQATGALGKSHPRGLVLYPPGLPDLSGFGDRRARGRGQMAPCKPAGAGGPVSNGWRPGAWGPLLCGTPQGKRRKIPPAKKRRPIREPKGS